MARNDHAVERKSKGKGEVVQQLSREDENLRKCALEFESSKLYMCQKSQHQVESGPMLIFGTESVESLKFAIKWSSR